MVIIVRTAFALIGILTLVGAAGHLQGASLEAVDSGNYSWEGYHSAGGTNYLSGDLAAAGFNEYRNFFVFDLSGLAQPVLGASLAIYNPSEVGDAGNGFESPDASETYVVYEVTTDIATLTGGGYGLTTVFDDLGGGIEFASVDISEADNGTVVLIPLNAEAVSAINASAGELWAVGGAVTTLAGSPLQIVFGYSDEEMQRQLVLDMGDTIFVDGFESGDTSAWSLASP